MFTYTYLLMQGGSGNEAKRIIGDVEVVDPIGALVSANNTAMARVVDAMKKAALGGGVHFVTAQEAIYDSVDPFTGNRLPINLRVTQVTDAGVASILKAFSAVSATPPHGHEKGRKPAPYDA